MTEDRADALLTSTQREFLSGEREMGDSASRTTRTRIRERIRAGLHDFALLADSDRLVTRDADQLADMSADEVALEDTLAEMVAFIYRLRPNAFEDIIAGGARRGVERFSPDHVVEDVDIQIHRRGQIIEQALHRLNENEPLTDREIRVLLADGDLPAEELREHVRENPSPRADNSLYGFR